MRWTWIRSRHDLSGVCASFCAAWPVAAVLFLCLVPALLLSNGPAAAGEMQTVRFRHDGHDREYLLYLPDRPPAGARPLVLVLHGGGGTHRGMVRLTRGRWNELADLHGFVVVYPNATDRIWDFGDGVVSQARDVRVDDLGYFQEVIRRVSAAYPVDARRIFATGISRGGQASYFLACRLPGRLRAIAPVAMPLPAFMEPWCLTAPPTGVMVINGTHDPLVPYNGGQIVVFRRSRGRVLSTKRTVDLWRSRNGCSGHGRVTRIDRPGDATRVVRTDWTACTGAPVTLVRVQNGGHTWPSGRPYLRRRLIGEVSYDIDAAREIWRFFSQF